jgi:hypothetical protein
MHSHDEGFRLDPEKVEIKERVDVGAEQESIVDMIVAV